MHAELLIGERGETILGVSALLLICMSITGFFLWWPPNGTGIGKLARGFKVGWSAPWKKVIFDLHRASGAYTIVFLLIIAFTGVSLVFNKAVIELTNFLTPLVLFVTGYLMWRNRTKAKAYNKSPRNLAASSTVLPRNK